MALIDEVVADLEEPRVTVPALGPVIRGGVSVLVHDCTHITSGVGWPAFDDALYFDRRDVGRAVLAPEACVVYDNTSSAAGGDAFYIRGVSGIQYWVGHITTVPPLNKRFRKGEIMTRISGDHAKPHVHLGVDARKLLGGRHLKSHTNYTHGAPKIGVQLAAVST